MAKFQTLEDFMPAYISSKAPKWLSDVLDEIEELESKQPMDFNRFDGTKVGAIVEIFHQAGLGQHSMFSRSEETIFIWATLNNFRLAPFSHAQVWAALAHFGLFPRRARDRREIWVDVPIGFMDRLVELVNIDNPVRPVEE
ncbi:MAG: hypothetical protein KDE50_36230 [Caldilineaceae bacterium]|nr:hypothetical protein [Caldilineaceae bacterium]